MLGQRASASAKRIYEVLDEQPTIVDAPDAIDLVDCRRRRPLRRRRLRLRRRAARARRLRRCTCARARRSRWSAARRAARRPSRGCCRASTTSPAARSRIDGHDVRDLTLDSLRSQDRRRARRAVPVLGLDPRQHRLRAARRAARGDRGGGARRRRRRVHRELRARLRHGRRRARLHAVRRPAPADRDRPHAAGQPADPGARRRHQRRRRPGRAGDPRGAAGS